MNDPQADGALRDTEKANTTDGNDWDVEYDQEDTLLKPSRWWFASTACPLIAGTFGPMANAFNICSLAQYWREWVGPGFAEGYGKEVKDPAWLTAINAVCVVIGLVANGALMLNMVGKVRFGIAQSMTIVGYYSSSFILIGLVAAANTDSFRIDTTPGVSSRSFLPSYYFACFAAGLYFFMASLSIFTVYGAVIGKYEKRFDINTAQQTLMMQTISLMAYLLIGAAIYTQVEGWRYNDAVYWSTFTLLTIGIGDRFVPLTHTGRTLLLFYTFGGIVAVGLVISSIRTLLLAKGAQKLHARTVEKKRQNIFSIEDARWGRGSWWGVFFNRRRAKGTPKFGDERERRQAEFNAMRTIQTRTTKVNRYRALAISSMNAAILWFIGAAVFYCTERHLQMWSYFECIYFAWTSLITLGYGDLQPLSNAGKAFFVLWALLAIPTLTVLVSDLSDTVVAWVDEATNFVASLTVSDRQTSLDNLRKAINWLSGGYICQSWSETRRKDREATENKYGRRGNTEQILERHLTQKEKDAIDAYAKKNDVSLTERDTHFYHFLLVKEIQAVLLDTQAQPPKEYTYDEWAYYLHLLGHDEGDEAYHTLEYNRDKHHKHDDEDAPQIARIIDHDGKPRPWAWLSLRSPLLGSGSEADWVLKRLLNKLQAEMRFQYHPGRAVEKRAPPVSLSALRGHSTGFKASEYPPGMTGKQLKESEATFDE